MSKLRLVEAMQRQGLSASRSEAESWIKLGRVYVDGEKVAEPSFFVKENARVQLKTSERYVSRAGLKLASVAKLLAITFADKVVLDVGSSTGGFTDYALQHGASKVYAVDVGTDQLHSSLRGDKRIELHEKTDIRDFIPDMPVDIVVMDVSFITLRDILPHIATLASRGTIVVAMVKPQFEAKPYQLNGGVVKNDAIRRDILREFEQWAKQLFVIIDKADSDIAGSKGNRERFYTLKLSK